MSQSSFVKQFCYLLLLIAPLIAHGFVPPQSPSIRTRLSTIRNSNPIQAQRRPRQANSIPASPSSSSSSSLLKAAEDSSSFDPVPNPPNVDVLQQAEQAKEQIQVQLKEAETRRVQLEKEIQSNASSAGKQTLESTLKQNEKDIQELQQLQQLAKEKFNSIQFPTLETLAESAKQVPTQTWAGTALGASLGGLAMGRINLQRRKKLKEEQEYEQRLAEAETTRNQKIAQANANRDRFLAAGSTLVVGTAVTALAQFSQTNSISANNNKRLEQPIVNNNNNNNNRLDASSTMRSNTPSPNLPYLEQKIQKAEDSVKNSQQDLQDTADRRKQLQQQLAREESFKKDLTQQLEQTEQSIRQANLAKERFEMESQLNARKAAVDIIALENIPQSSSLSEKAAAQEQAKKEVQMAEAQRLAAFAETQRISEMERKLDQEVKARMELLQKLQSTEASLKQANDRAQLAAMEAQLATETKDQALAQAKATTEKALAEKQKFEQQAAAETKKAQLAALETQKVTESNERAMAEVLEWEQLAAEAKAEAEGKARIAMQLQQQQQQQQQEKPRQQQQQQGVNAFLSSIPGAVTSKADLVDTKGLSSMLQQSADAFQAKRDETTLVTRAAVDELLASARANADFNAFQSSLMAKSLADSFGEENVPMAVAGIIGTGAAATGLIAAGVQNSKKKDGPDAVAQNIPSNPLQGYTPATNPQTGGFQSNNQSPQTTSRQASFFTSKDPRTGISNKKDVSASTDANQSSSFFTSKEPRTDFGKSQQTNFFTKKDSFQNTPPGFLSALGGLSSKGKEQTPSATKGTLKGGVSSNAFKTTSSEGTPRFGLATGGVVPISTTASAPSPPKFGARNGSAAPSFGSPKGSTPSTAGGFKGSNENGNRDSGSTSNSPSFAAPKTSTSFGTSNGAADPNGPVFPKSDLSSKRSTVSSSSSNFGAPKGSTMSAASPTTMESKGQKDVAGFGDRNGVSARTTNRSTNGFGSAFSASESVGAPKGFSPYGSKGATKSNASTAKGSNQSSFNPSNSPFGNSNAASSFGASSSTKAPSSKGFSPNTNFSGTAQSNPSSFNPANSPFGQSNGASSAGVTSSSTSAPPNGFNPSNPTNSAGAGSWSAETSLSSMGGYTASGPSSGATQSNSYNPSNSQFGNSNGSATTNGAISRRAESASKGYGTASASNGYNLNNGPAGAAQSSQPSFNPSNSPFGNNNGAQTTGAFNRNQGVTNEATNGWNQNPSFGRPNSASLTQASSASPGSRSSDTSGDEERWRESKPNQGDWWNVEKRDYFTTLGRRETKSFTGRNLDVPSSNTAASPYSPFGNSKQSPTPTQSSMQPYSPPPSVGKGMDTNQEEQLWRQTATPGGQWFETERIDHYTDRGVRVTRSFSPNGVSTSSISSYSPFGQQNFQAAASIPPAAGANSGITPQNIYKPYNGKTSPTLDASQTEQRWRESSATPGGQWFEQEKLDFYTSGGTRATRSFNGDGIATDVGPNTKVNGSWQ